MSLISIKYMLVLFVFSEFLKLYAFIKKLLLFLGESTIFLMSSGSQRTSEN